MVKRLFDILASLVGIVILSPLFIVLAVGVVLSSKGGAFFTHLRVGKDGEDLNVFKFRTMTSESEESSELTLGDDDVRITGFGRTLRRYKLDELPQLFNVLIGNMSLVGPRPEVRKYVNNYTKEQLLVLSVKPGITDFASIEYSNEGELLGKSEDPERLYIEEVLPRKLELGIKYVREQSLGTDLSIIFRTLWRIIS